MILVTGAAGFIGSVLVKELNVLGRTDIVIVDRLHDKDKWKNLRGLKYDRFIHADDFLSDEYIDLWNHFDQVFHIGACSSTTEKDVDYLMDNNVNYSKKIFDLCSKHDVPLVYASSAATYGDGELGYSDSHALVPKLCPMNAYGYSKQVFDEWALQQKMTPPVWFGMKFFNVFGPNEYHKDDMRSLVHKAYGQILDSGKVKLFKSHRKDFKDGEQLRDFVYVRDVVKVMIELSKQKKKTVSGIYNLGTGKAGSFKDLVTATFKAMNKKVNIEFIDMPLSIRNQYQYYTEADMGKLKKVLPKFKFMSLEESVSDYVKNYLVKDNPYY